MTRPLPAAMTSGQPVTRVDGRLKVTGKALYAADNPAPAAARSKAATAPTRSSERATRAWQPTRLIWRWP